MKKGLAESHSKDLNENDPSSKHRDNVERRLLAAATKIIAKHGVDGLTLGQVGIAAGYSRGLPAHYYGNKNGLLAAVAGFIVDSFANRLAQTSKFNPGIDALLGSVRSYLDPSLKNPALSVVIAESLTEGALRPAIADVNRRSIQRLASVIRVAISKGEIRSDIEPERQAILILGTLRSLITLWLVDGRDVQLGTIRDAYVAALHRSLAPKR